MALSYYFYSQLTQLFTSVHDFTHFPPSDSCWKFQKNVYQWCRSTDLSGLPTRSLSDS